jgi:protein tyrosine phosphatase (PTP) superfamily phosphohydrolase (DUF442 family)
MTPLESPTSLGEIRNFAWVQPGRVACGEQPPSESAYRLLQQVGIASILSLRAAEEPAQQFEGWVTPYYRVDDEATRCHHVGLRFRHVPWTDNAAPDPTEVAEAICVLQEEVDEGRPVYVHCLAGSGRTGVISATWLMAQGVPAAEAIRNYGVFVDHFRVLRQITDEDRRAYFLRVGVGEQTWALEAIATALGRANTETSPLVPPRAPPGSEAWAVAYAMRLRRWRA